MPTPVSKQAAGIIDNALQEASRMLNGEAGVDGGILVSWVCVYTFHIATDDEDYDTGYGFLSTGGGQPIHVSNGLLIEGLKYINRDAE